MPDKTVKKIFKKRNIISTPDEQTISSETVKECWDKNADTWADHSRAGYDTYRDHFNTPRFLEMLPTIKNLFGLDVGCGEGYNTRLLAKQGAKMTGVDISKNFIKRCIEAEKENHLDINYIVCNAETLPFGDNTYDFATAFMSMMDMAEVHKAISEVYRVIKNSGFFQFSILHPCFFPPGRKTVRDENGKELGIIVSDYFVTDKPFIEEWKFSALSQKMKDDSDTFKIPCFHRTLSEWMNTLINTGFTIKQIQEPYVNDEQLAKFRNLYDTRITAYFLHILVEKS